MGLKSVFRRRDREVDLFLGCMWNTGGLSQLQPFPLVWALLRKIFRHAFVPNTMRSGSGW